MAKLLPKLLGPLQGDTLAVATEKVRDAMKILARRTAEAEYHRTLVNFHEAEALDIDPHQDWNGFAAQKEAAHTHRQDLQVEERKVATAAATLRAAQQRLRKLRGIDETPRPSNPTETHA